jgi:hypothetical protein
MPSFKEFREELLLRIAFATEGNPSTTVDPKQVADEASLAHRPGWVRQAASHWAALGALEVSETLGGGDDGGINTYMTAAGMIEAEGLAHERAYDLYEEMDERRSSSVLLESPQVVSSATTVPASDRIVRIDHNLKPITELQEKLDEVVTWMEADNSLSQEEDAREQRLAELKAGKVVLEAPQASETVLEWLLIRPLKWILEKAAESSVATVVAILLTLLLTLFGVGG